MSSYRNHAIAGIIFALPFIPSFFYLFIALIGASIPDMDHNTNNIKVYSMFIVGLVLSVLLFFVDGVSLSALIILVLAILFYFSKHRGFTHSLLGVIILSFLFMLMFMGFIPVLSRLSLYLGYSIPSNLMLFIILALMGYFVVSRRYLLHYLAVLALYLLVFPVDYSLIQWNVCFLMLFIGGFSHIILDLWTPKGIKVFKPFVNTTYHRSLAVIFVAIWIIASFFAMWHYGTFITLFHPIFTYA